jgi:hypothetical protein
VLCPSHKHSSIIFSQLLDFEADLYALFLMKRTWALILRGRCRLQNAGVTVCHRASSCVAIAVLAGRVFGSRRPLSPVRYAGDHRALHRRVRQRYGCVFSWTRPMPPVVTV